MSCNGLTTQTGISWLHVILTLLLIEFALLLRCCILVLLVLRDEIVHVALGLCELHLVHTLARVPVKECLTTEHGREVLSNTLEHLLNRRGVAQERHCHLEALWRDVADGALNVVGDPFYKVGAVLVLHVQHLFVDFLCGHTATEKRGSSQVTTMAWISCAHHVLCIEHLLRELGHCESTVLLWAPGRKWSKACHEKVKPREWDKVHCDLAQVTIELSWEAEACGTATQGCTHEMVKVTICRRRQLQGAEADIVQGLIVQQHALISILHQ